MYSHSNVLTWYLIMVLICILLLVMIWRFFSCSYLSFVHSDLFPTNNFLTVFFVFLLLLKSFMYSKYESLNSYTICKHFPNFIQCFFIFFTVYCEAQKFLILKKPNLFFVAYAFDTISKKALPHAKLKRFTSKLHSETCLVLVLISDSLCFFVCVRCEVWFLLHSFPCG